MSFCPLLRRHYAFPKNTDEGFTDNCEYVCFVEHARDNGRNRSVLSPYLPRYHHHNVSIIMLLESIIITKSFIGDFYHLLDYEQMLVLCKKTSRKAYHDLQ